MLLQALLFLLVTVCLQSRFQVASAERSFEVDWAHDQFLKDGEPFRFISGSFHYFRAHPDTWQRKLRTMRAAGLNAVATYVEWSTQNPKEEVYIWNGIANLERFIQLAEEEDLLVILRPGPYICAERDFGGFPYWLLTKYPNIKLRTTDINYLNEVRRWYNKLMPKMVPYLYGNGGPIIMVQVENEYGSFGCDNNYKTWMLNETKSHVKDKAVLFTNDGPYQTKCGYIEGVLATLDFGSGTSLTYAKKKLRESQPNGPFVNIEYYPGWLTHWGEVLPTVNINNFVKTFNEMLKENASVNIYVFYGGTNFGFTAGANDGGPGNYEADITSYDYEAPISEAGNTTTKYFIIRDEIRKYLPLPNISVPEVLPKKNYGTVKLYSCCGLLSQEARCKLSAGVTVAEQPKTFEALNQYSGLVLYETLLPRTNQDPSILRIPGLRDRAYVYVDNEFVGILSRGTPVYNLPISISAGTKLQIFVENQGRLNFGPLTSDFKGILGKVNCSNKVLTNWTMTQFPFESYHDIESLVVQESARLNEIDSTKMLQNGPTIFYGAFQVKDPYDTFLDTSGWNKGVVFVNGENLGRYWPVVGPQVTLYVPGQILKTGINMVVLIEYQKASPTNLITFRDSPIYYAPPQPQKRKSVFNT